MLHSPSPNGSESPRHTPGVQSHTTGAYPPLLCLAQVIADTEGSAGEECNAAQAAQGAGGAEADAWAIELLGKPLQP